VPYLNILVNWLSWLRLTEKLIHFPPRLIPSSTQFSKGYNRFRPWLR